MEILRNNDIPLQADLKDYAPTYLPEQFTDEEKVLLAPFVSNLDGPVYILQNLPEEVLAALKSRYSRSTASLRRTLLDEYLNPIAYPDRQTSWQKLSSIEKYDANILKNKLAAYFEFTKQNGLPGEIFNTKRAREFFNKWLADYGDDSIAELGAVHIAIEGISSLALEELVDKRVGVSLLVKSSRYVSFSDKDQNGHFKYVIPGEIRDTELQDQYRQTMDLLFTTYAQLEQPYLEYICAKYPKGTDETDGSFRRSRGARRYDDLRDLLPFATQNNLGILINARSAEDLVNRFALHPLGEARWLAKEIFTELQKVIPSLVSRPGTKRGAEVQRYRRAVSDHQYLSHIDPGLRSYESNQTYPKVELVSYTPDADVEVLSNFIFRGCNLPLSKIRNEISQWSDDERLEALRQILDIRNLGDSDIRREVVRFRKVPRAFESAMYTFEFWGRGGDYRDLHRHRQMSEGRQLFTNQWGYDLEQDVLNSPFVDEIRSALDQAGTLASVISKTNPNIAQYSIPFGYIQHWYAQMSARSIYWQAELRTGPQGRPHYRKIVQEIARLASVVSPNLFTGMHVDNSDYALSRRESEIKKARKAKDAG